MIPELSHIEFYKGYNFYITTDGICGLAFDIEPCDLESEDTEDFHQKLTMCLRKLEPDILGRIRFESKPGEALDSVYPRAKAINDLGYRKHRVSLILDFTESFNPLKDIKNFFHEGEKVYQREYEILLRAVHQVEQFGFVLTPFQKIELERLFLKGPSEWVRTGRSIETGTESIGVIRLIKQPVDSFTPKEWTEVLEKLPSPFQLTISFQRMKEERAKLFLEKRLRQARSSVDVSSKRQSEVTESLIQENFESGVSLFEIEIVFTFSRDSQKDLTMALRNAVSQINLFAESVIETSGVAPSYCVSLAGNLQYVTLIETDLALAGLLPIYLRKSNDGVKSLSRNRALTLHRENQALSHFDLFDSSFEVFNSLIVGTSGKGKSVLTGLLTECLLNDPSVCIIKLDVGGSHSKECELFGGVEYQMRLDKTSGVNAFEVLNLEASESEKISILSKFLGSLIKEEGETQLTKSLRTDIEASVSDYIEMNPQYPSLQDFYDQATNFPRRGLLRRWVQGGVYEKAFEVRNPKKEIPVKDQYADQRRSVNTYSYGDNRPVNRDSGEVQRKAKGSLNSDQQSEISLRPGSSERKDPVATNMKRNGLTPLSSQLRYYNLSQVFNAADADFAQAAIAAILAQFNMEVLRSNGKRIVLICDEVPFFIKNNFEFFKFSTANVRKYGHAVVLISQLSTDLIVNGDMGIIENSPQRFLFSVDGDEISFMDRFYLTKDQLNQIKNLRSIQGAESQVLLQSKNSAQKLRVKVTREEYWRLTTSRVDKDKLITLLGAVPGLSLREAIRCLAAVDI